MPYVLESRLVVAVSSRALFALDAENHLFDGSGDDAYMRHQREHERVPLEPGIAFPFIQRLIGLNELRPGDPLVEVVLLSRNDANSGLRIMNSIKHHGLGDITRAVFTRGHHPYEYLKPLRAHLFLSANEPDVRAATAAGHPAGLVLGRAPSDPPGSAGNEFRIAFDFDGVIADDAAERVYQQSENLQAFFASEVDQAFQPHSPGPLKPLLDQLGRIQALESQRRKQDPAYEPRLRIALVTARNAPAHERAIRTLRSWNIDMHEALFLGGVAKADFLEVLRPHIYFDDQMRHLEGAAGKVPSVHVPYGILNLPRSASGEAS